jgi:hypothetical protein
MAVKSRAARPPDAVTWARRVDNGTRGKLAKSKLVPWPDSHRFNILLTGQR